MATFIDFCSGIGGARLGLEQNGLKCLGFSEIDKSAITTYRNFFNTSNEIEFGDLTKINPNKLPNFDLLISGFPCQTFSIVGKREGLCDKDKGQIIFYLAQILKVKRPKFFILENVKGLINHAKGETLKIILNLLDECGYNVTYKVLNSNDFGLCQNRERVYFVGILKGIQYDFSNMWNFVTLKNDIKNFLNPTKSNLIDKNSTQYATFLKYLQNKYNKDKFDLNEILKHDYLVLDTRQSDLRFYENKIPTIRRDRQGILYVYRENLYRLSASEALKFQGFNVIDNIENKISNLKESDILRQCGNAMSVNVIKQIAFNLKRACNE